MDRLRRIKEDPVIYRLFLRFGRIYVTIGWQIRRGIFIRIRASKSVQILERGIRYRIGL